MVERLHGMQEVRGPNPLFSTKNRRIASPVLSLKEEPQTEIHAEIPVRGFIVCHRSSRIAEVAAAHLIVIHEIPLEIRREIQCEAPDSPCDIDSGLRSTKEFIRATGNGFLNVILSAGSITSGSTIQNSAKWRGVLEFSARNVGPKV